MAYDDIVWDDENPAPGQLFNKQGGDDVYLGCKLDYSGADVNVQNFLAVMKGDSQAVNTTVANSTKRVLKSDMSSKVFLYFSDHGAPGHLMFPDTVIYAD
jgi:legumain